LGFGLEKAAEYMQKEEFKAIEDSGNPCVLLHTKHSGVGNYAKCASMIDHALFENGYLYH
jgi:hypothetical protein